jgi:BirA family biotin operon repressor/biotin-[acetyl-CoA-carboxylase] ligase
VWLRAERQTAGRGRQGKAWISPSGNLYASTLVRSQPHDPPAPTLALVAAIALQEVASIFGVEATIKWPNDLLAGGHKLSGILLERADDTVVIGFGVNLACHPENLDRPATSIASITGNAPDPEVFLAALIASFARWLSRWRMEGLASVRDRWLEKAHPIGSALTTRLPDGKSFDGLFCGLDEGGALRLRLADGSVHVIHAADVFLIRD